MKAEKIIESLKTTENLIAKVREGVQDRKDGKYKYYGVYGETTNSNLKEKIRVARGMLMEVAHSLNFETFDKED